MSIRKFKAKLAGLISKKYKVRILSGLSVLPTWDNFSYSSMKYMLFRRLESKEKQEQKNNIILGPCYGRHDWITTDEDLNLSWGGEDLYMSYQLLYKHIALLKNLKNIVLFYGTFSKGQDNEYTGFSNISAMAKVLFSIPYHNEDRSFEIGFADFERFYGSQIYKLKKRIKNLDSSYIPYERDFIPDEEFAKIVALGHYKNNQREINQNIWLEQLLNLAQKENKNVFIVIPPYKHQYRKYLPAVTEIFSDVFNYEKQYKNLKILNFYEYNFDEDRDFMDYEHLNRNGAEKLTKLIKAVL